MFSPVRKTLTKNVLSDSAGIKEGSFPMRQLKPFWQIRNNNWIESSQLRNRDSTTDVAFPNQWLRLVIRLNIWQDKQENKTLFFVSYKINIQFTLTITRHLEMRIFRPVYADDFCHTKVASLLRYRGDKIALNAQVILKLQLWARQKCIELRDKNRLCKRGLTRF